MLSSYPPRYVTHRPARMSPSRRFLAVLIGALLTAGAVGAGAMVYEPPARVAATATTTTVAVLAAPVPLPSPAPVTAATAPPPAAAEAVEEEVAEIVEETTTTVPPTTTTTIPGSKPPVSGAYRYRKQITDDEGTSETINGRILVQSSREVGGETHQEHLDSDPKYGTSSEGFIWRADGVYLHTVGDASGEDAYKCDFQPDILLYPLPLTVGREWTIDSSCSYQIEGEQIADRLQGTSRIVRTERITVAGQEVEVYVIETNGSLDDGEFRFEFQNTDFFSAEVRLTVREEAHNRYLHNGEPLGEEDEKFELLTLKPQ